MAHPRRGTKDERQTIPPQATSDMGDIWRSLSGRNDRSSLNAWFSKYTVYIVMLLRSLGGLGKDYVRFLHTCTENRQLVESRVPGKADDDRVFAYCSTDATSNRVKSLAQRSVCSCTRDSGGYVFFNKRYIKYNCMSVFI